ncbi:Sorting nexin-20 [Trichoplax sp. H2]|nr:Sorting nexin-20 [Trichoplax sp. H2]|eukprot:RDD44134.1 Sorting nexin-20 [Trichoplax sp. H2]
MSCDQWVSKFEIQPSKNNELDDHEVDEDEVDVENNCRYEFAASPLAGRVSYYEDDEGQKLERNLDTLRALTTRRSIADCENLLRSGDIPLMTGDNNKGGRHRLQDLKFESVAARTVTEGKKKFVLYALALVRTDDTDEIPPIIERRYSQFATLHKALSSSHPQIVKKFNFPRKVAMGNFSQSTIIKRSTAFQDYLNLILKSSNYDRGDSVPYASVRYTKAFEEFLYISDLRKAYRAIRDSDYSSAAEHLRIGLNIQLAVLSYNHPEVIGTMCAVIIVYNALQRYVYAINTADTTLQWIGNSTECKYYLPLLQDLVRLSFNAGYNNEKYQKLLTVELKNRNMLTSNIASLSELVFNTFQD